MAEGYKTLGEYWEEAKRIYSERRNRGEPEFPTGLTFLDDVTDGLSRGELWVVAGKTASGKTTLALQIAASFADNPKHSITFLSLEMKGWELVSRLFCAIEGISFSAMRMGLLPPGYPEKEKDFREYIKNIDFQIYERGYEFEEIVSIIKKDYKTKKPDVIFIDFLQLISWRKYEKERIALMEYIRKLKELANQLNIGVVVISQLKRLKTEEAYSRPPDVIDLKGSGAIENAADKILFIYKRTVGLAEGDKQQYFINLAKNRQGMLIEREVEFLGDNYKFREKKEVGYELG